MGAEDGGRPGDDAGDGAKTGPTKAQIRLFLKAERNAILGMTAFAGLGLLSLALATGGPGAEDWMRAPPILLGLALLFAIGRWSHFIVMRGLRPGNFAPFELTAPAAPRQVLFRMFDDTFFGPVMQLLAGGLPGTLLMALLVPEAGGEGLPATRALGLALMGAGAVNLAWCARLSRWLGEGMHLRLILLRLPMRLLWPGIGALGLALLLAGQGV